MPTEHTRPLSRLLLAAALRADDERPDRELLARFVATRDEDAVAEPPARDSGGFTSPGSPEDADLRRVIDEELAAVPEKYRTCVVLCDLEGLSRKDAAAKLRIPEGTLSSRLNHARKALAARLT